MFDTMKVKVLFAVLLVLIPGCIEGVDEEFPSSNWAFDPMYNGTYSNVSLNLFQGESLQNATATYTITIMLNHTAAPVLNVQKTLMSLTLRKVNGYLLMQ